MNSKIRLAEMHIEVLYVVAPQLGNFFPQEMHQILSYKSSHLSYSLCYSGFYRQGVQRSVRAVIFNQCAMGVP